MMTLMRNGRAVDRKTREVPREERTRGIDWDRSVDHIRASSHNGCIKRPDTWLHPYRFAKGQILFPCTAGAVHTWHTASNRCGAKVRTPSERSGHAESVGSGLI